MQKLPTIEAKEYLDRVNYNGVTVVNAEHDTYFAVINYAGKDYYVKNNSTEFIYNAEESRYDLVNATLYTIYDQNGNSTFDSDDIFVLDMVVNKQISPNIIKNNNVLKLVPVLLKQKHNIEASATGVITEDRTAMTTIKDIEGNDTTLSGNAVSVTDNAGVEVSQYCYEQQVVVTYELNDDFYNFTGFYIEIGGTIYDLATRNNGTWTIGNYFYEASGQTQLGTVVTNGDNSIKLTFDKIAPSDVKIYAAFDGKIANIAIGDVKDASQNILLDAVVVNYDGKGANKAYTFSSSSDIISSTSSTISSVKFGDVGARTIVYRLSQDATMNLVGWAVYDSKVMNGTLEDKITIIYNYATPVTVTGSDDTVSMSYLDLFTNSADISVLENLFNGSSQYTLIPVLEQKTLTINLKNASLDGDGNGTADGETGADVTGLTYYAGGDGLDISSHAAHFAKTGYTPSGWEGVAPISAYKTSEAPHGSVTANPFSCGDPGGILVAELGLVLAKRFRTGRIFSLLERKKEVTP